MSKVFGGQKGKEEDEEEGLINESSDGDSSIGEKKKRRWSFWNSNTTPGATTAEQERLISRKLSQHSPNNNNNNNNDNQTGGSELTEMLSGNQPEQDLHMGPTTVLLSLHDEPLPVDLGFFRIEREPSNPPTAGSDLVNPVSRVSSSLRSQFASRVSSPLVNQKLGDQDLPKEDDEEADGSGVFSLALGFVRYLLFIGRESGKERKGRRRNMLRLATALLGIVLMIIELEVSYRDWEAEGTRINFPTLYHTLIPQILKVFITINSVTLMAQTIEYYRLRKPQLVGGGKHWLGTLSRDFRNRRRLGGLLFELFICAIHAPPFMDVLTNGWFSDKVGLLMFLRLYLVLRVLRDFSTIFRNRRKIMLSMGMSHISPHFGTLLTIKHIFHVYPITFLTTWLLASSFVMGYCIYVFEREGDAHEQFETFWPGLYLAFQIMISGWATDTFDVVDPVTVGGKAMCLACCVLGLFLFSLLIDFVHYRMVPSSLEEFAVDWVMDENIKRKEKQAAAEVIQAVYRFYRFKKTVKIQSDFSDLQTTEIVKKYTFEYVQRLQKLHAVKRERIEFSKIDRRASLLEEQQQREQPQPPVSAQQQQQLSSMEQRICKIEDSIGDLSTKMNQFLRKGSSSVPHVEGSLNRDLENRLIRLEEQNQRLLSLLEEECKERRERRDKKDKRV